MTRKKGFLIGMVQSVIGLLVMYFQFDHNTPAWLTWTGLVVIGFINVLTYGYIGHLVEKNRSLEKQVSDTNQAILFFQRFFAPEDIDARLYRHFGQLDADQAALNLQIMVLREKSVISHQDYNVLGRLADRFRALEREQVSSLKLVRQVYPNFPSGVDRVYGNLLKMDEKTNRV